MSRRRQRMNPLWWARRLTSAGRAVTAWVVTGVALMSVGEFGGPPWFAMTGLAMWSLAVVGVGLMVIVDVDRGPSRRWLEPEPSARQGVR